METDSPIWSPSHIGQINSIERVQRSMTSKIPSVAHLSYPNINGGYIQRLEALKLISLEERRLNTDLCVLFKIVHGLLDCDVKKVVQLAPRGRTRGHSLKLILPKFRLDVKKYSFPTRTIPVWNELPENVVTSTSSRSFRNRLENINLTRFLKGCGTQ